MIKLFVWSALKRGRKNLEWEYSKYGARYFPYIENAIGLEGKLNPKMLIENLWREHRMLFTSVCSR